MFCVFFFIGCLRHSLYYLLGDPSWSSHTYYSIFHVDLFKDLFSLPDDMTSLSLKPPTMCGKSIKL